MAERQEVLALVLLLLLVRPATLSIAYSGALHANVTLLCEVQIPGRDMCVCAASISDSSSFFVACVVAWQFENDFCRKLACPEQFTLLCWRKQEVESLHTQTVETLKSTARGRPLGYQLDLPFDISDLFLGKLSINQGSL